MTVIEDTNSSLLQRFKPDNRYTSASSDTELANTTDWEDKNRKKWNDIIDMLLEWWKNPNQLIWDNDFIPPSQDLIGHACQAVSIWRDSGKDAFDRVVPDGEGGIAFEAYRGSHHVSLTLNSDLSMEFLHFEDCRLVESYNI